MAFPTIPTTGAGRLLSNTQANTSGTRTFPSLTGLTKNSGDLLIAICIVYQSSASAGAVFSGWGGGFTEFADLGGSTSNMSIGAAYKVSNGTETGTFTVTQAATVTGHAAMFLMSIPGASVALAPVAGTIVHGTTSAANIAALDPATWGTLDTLWIAVAGSGETATTGSFTGGGAEPTNYSGIVFTGISGDVVGGVEGSIAFRQLNAASEDPGAFTVDVSAARNSAVLLAVSPAASVVSITHAQETAAAQQISGTTLVRNITTATETDLVGEIVPLQTLPATETDSTFSRSTQSGHSITTSTTTASAQALNVDKAVTITLAAETDSIPSTSKTLVPVTETDSAQALVVTNVTTVSITLVTETDLAGDIVEFQPLPALTTAAAQALTVTQSGLALTPATSTAAAQILSFTQGGGYTIAPATETDLVGTIVAFQPLPASTTATALPLSVTFSGRNIAPALETDSAQSIAPGAGVNLVEWETTAPIPYNTKAAVGDLSTALALSISSGAGLHKTISPATTTESAQALTVRKAVTITLVSATNTAQALTKQKTLGITTASSTASAIGLVFSGPSSTTYTIETAISTNTAQSLVLFKQILVTVGIALEVDTARITRAANRPSGGLALIDHEPNVGLILIDQGESVDLALIDI